MTEKLWTECSKEERDEIKHWGAKRKALKATYQMGYLTPAGYEYYKEILGKELDDIESKYNEEDISDRDSYQLPLF